MSSSTWNIVANFTAQLNNSSATCRPFGKPESTTERAVMATGYAVLLFMSLMGNVLLIIVFYKRYNQLRTPVNYFIVNMAASDLLVPLFVLPRLIQEVYLGFGPWLVGGVFGDMLCRVVHFAEEVSVTVSSQCMVFIAAERFWSIVYPTKLSPFSRRTTPRIICFTWVFSSIYFSYYLFAYKLIHKNRTPFCNHADLPHIFRTWQDLWRADRLGLLVIFVGMPFILITAFYTSTIVSLCRNKNITNHLASEAQLKRAKKNRRITFMLLTVVIIFFISWTPYYIYFFVYYYSLGTNWSCSSVRRIYWCGKYMNYIFTAINPLIYYTFNPIYRQGFHDLFRCPWSCPCGCRQNKVLQMSILQKRTKATVLYRRNGINLRMPNQT